MTTIAGIVHKDRVWLAGDSCISWGDRVEVVREPKVWVSRGIAIGAAGPLRGLQLLQHRLKIPALPKATDDDDLARWLTVRLPDEIRKCYAGEKEVECDLLIGVRGWLVVVDSDHSWIHPADGIGAVGSGADSAVATLRASSRRAAPKTRLARALTAATAQGSGTRPWFRYVSV